MTQAQIRLELKIAQAHVLKGNFACAEKTLRRCLGPMNKAKQMGRAGHTICAITALKRVQKQLEA